MATLKGGNGAGTRIAAGDAVLERAKRQKTGKVTARLGAFTDVHGKYVGAEAKVAKAEAALVRAQEAVGAADVWQDETVEALATALAGDGHKRENPFKQLGFPAPSVVTKQGYEAEAKTVAKLAAAVAKKKGLSKRSLAAAETAKKAAANVAKLIAPRTAAEATYKKALAARDALAQPWETAFASLKRGAKAAEDEGAPGLFQALFGTTAPRKVKKTPKPAPPPATPPPATPQPAPETPPPDPEAGGTKE